jgi:polyprenyl P-hydroxybenzoate/phenylacrylic acid decarboxylase-like protein
MTRSKARTLARSHELIIGVTGGTGAIYAQRLLQWLARREGLTLHVITSPMAVKIIELELGRGARGGRLRADQWVLPKSEWRARVLEWDDANFMAPIASGSHVVEGMVIVPCSMRALASVDIGLGDTLIHRAADCCLKEHRRLVLVPRESPLTAAHLEQMARLARQGVTILTPDPAWYTKPKTLDDFVDQIAMKICDHLGIAPEVERRWGNSAR